MIYRSMALLGAFFLTSAAGIPALAQSVISAHSGIVYFFDGSVQLGDQTLEQKFGRFPDIGEGHELRTGNGRAEVLLTLGVFLRIGENSSIRLVSNKLSDTRVEFLAGSGILESTERESGRAVTVIYKSWRVSLPEEGVCRISSEPARVNVYRGSAEVSVEGKSDKVSVRAGETLPLQPILLTEHTVPAISDDFREWAMGRSQAIASDNATAAGILDDPDAIDQAVGSLDIADLGALGGLSYFPLTGIPGVAVTNPYGLSFWSPFQSTLSSIYLPGFRYGVLYPVGWPSTVRSYPTYPYYPLHPIGTSSVGLHPTGGYHPVGITSSPRSTYSPAGRTPASHPVPAPHAPAHAVGHR